ncbi:MAG TPA: prepilin-type N-terminal cleavage/methylation domain-containing protein [Vicinamibacterales bacterium]|nr:prepilin-type N-terminal cleavage/methylation domain-containing protein [Vicinamibacterales bacterium]
MSKTYACGTSKAEGFSLIEVLVSVALLSVVSLGVAQLFAVATKANFASKGQTSTALLAVQKMEQLKGLTWGYDQQSSALGLPASDTTSDLSQGQPTGGGAGLNPSPPGALTQNTSGYVDYLDTNGVWVGTGTVPPGNTSYVRRWSITPLPTNPNNTLVFQVRVMTLQQANAVAAAGVNAPTTRFGEDTWLTSVKTRKAQ